MAAITSAANTGSTEMTLIASVVQDALNDEAVIAQTSMDWTPFVEDGIKRFEVPRFADGANGKFGDPEDQNPDGETPVTKKVLSFTNDAIDLDQWKNLCYTVPDRVKKQSRIPLDQKLFEQAGTDMALYVDKKIRDEYRTLTQTVTMTGPADTASGATATLSLSDLTEARRILNKANVKKSERYLLISPDQEKAMLNIDNFIKANEYGARDGLLNGEIGRVFGMTVLVSNLLDAEESYVVQKDCVAHAMQEQINYEVQRADVSLRADDHSFAIGWGCTLTYGGVKGVKFSA